MPKPPWQQFLEMTPEQAAAQEAADLALVFTADMTQERALACLAKRRERMDRKQREVEGLQAIHRLAAASGCPKRTSPIPWLVKKGLLAEDEDGAYHLTEKATALRLV
jgi:hypothetical protein